MAFAPIFGRANTSAVEQAVKYIVSQPDGRFNTLSFIARFMLICLQRTRERMAKRLGRKRRTEGERDVVEAYGLL